MIIMQDLQVEKLINLGEKKRREVSGLLADYKETIDRIHQSLKWANSVVIGVHEHPDGDAVGSALALYNALVMQGKKVVIYAPDPPPESLSFIPGFEKITTQKPRPSDFDVVVLLDSTRIWRTHLFEEIKGHKCTICIDHHLGNPGEADINLIVPKAAATAHILMGFFEQTRTPVTQDMATGLLTGIFTDTGSFMHDSTTPGALKVAAKLMGKGARLSHIAHETYQKKDLAGLRIWGRALSRIMVNEQSGAAVSVITPQDLEECGAELEDLSGVVNQLNTLPEAKFAMLLCEYEPGKIKGSLRSEPHKGIDVSALAEKLGGGGHKLAAGFELQGSIIKKKGKWRIIKLRN